MFKCIGCEILKEALAVERKRNDELMDRLMILAGKPEATTEAIRPESSETPADDDDPPLDDEQINALARKELEDYALATGAPIESLHDLP